MAAKHDGKHARANMWVTHQNLARAKGGYPQYVPKAHRAPAVQKRAITIEPKKPAELPDPE